MEIGQGFFWHQHTGRVQRAGVAGVFSARLLGHLRTLGRFACGCMAGMYVLLSLRYDIMWSKMLLVGDRRSVILGASRLFSAFTYYL